MIYLSIVAADYWGFIYCMSPEAQILWKGGSSPMGPIKSAPITAADLG